VTAELERARRSEQRWTRVFRVAVAVAVGSAAAIPIVLRVLR
jgi:hypothetical protein